MTTPRPWWPCCRPPERDLVVEARELELRAERRIGELLLVNVRRGDSRTSLWRQSQTGPPRNGRAQLKPGALGEIGLTAKESSAAQALARIDVHAFEAELARRHDQGIPASRRALLALQDGLVRPPARRTTPTAQLLRHALGRLQRVRSITSQDELALVRQVLAITHAWAAQLSARSTPPPQDGPPVTFACLLCGRQQIARRCASCRGW